MSIQACLVLLLVFMFCFVAAFFEVAYRIYSDIRDEQKRKGDKDNEISSD